MSIPKTMKASIVQADKTVAVQESAVPTIKGNEILLKTIAVGQNPTDWKHAAMLSTPGAAIGCDFVGEVVEIGPDVPSGAVSKGEVRSGFIRGGMSPDAGAFAEYVKSEYDLTFVVPSNITPQQAASAPIPLFTATQSLWFRLGLPRPDQDTAKVRGKWILIWSGSTAVGQYAIQLARLSGLRVATTCSPRRNDLVKQLGAEVVVDYNDPNVSQKLFDATEGQIVYGLDTIAENGSIQKAQLAFAKEGGHLVTLLFDLKNLPRSEVKTEATLAYTQLGADHGFGPSFLAKTSPEDRAQYVSALKLATTLFAEKKLQPLEVEDIGGLENVQKGFQMMIDGRHTSKIVYTV